MSLPRRAAAAAWVLLLACSGPARRGLPDERLASLLVQGPPVARPRAALALGARGGRAAAAALAARLDPSVPDPAEAAAVCRALGSAGREEAVAPLLRLWEALLTRKVTAFGLPPALESVRAEAAAALGRLGDIRAVPALRRGLIDDDPAVAARSAEALGLLGDAGSTERLAALASGPDPRAARAALESLGLVGGADAESALRAAAEGADAARAAAAAYGMARRGLVGGRLRLEGFLEESLEATPEGVLAAGYLARLGRAEGVAFLAKAAAAGPLRAEALAALGASGSEAAVPAAAAAAGGPDPGLRLAAARALALLPGRRAEEALRALASGEDAAAREAALDGLAARGVLD